LKIREKSDYMGFQAMPIFLLALLIAYPAAIHLTIINGYTITALLILLSAFILLFINTWSNRLLLGVVSAGAVILLSSVIDIHSQFILYLVPVLINAGLALYFGQTLIPGKTPIITQYAIYFRGELDPKAVIYTRRVTKIWVLLFIFLAIEALLLALFASIEIWSLFVNILNYLFIALLFAGEYYIRVHYLDDRGHLTFARFLYKLTQVKFSELNK
jgi:uncharacterized membrane protein